MDEKSFIIYFSKIVTFYGETKDIKVDKKKLLLKIKKCFSFKKYSLLDCVIKKNILGCMINLKSFYRKFTIS